VRLVRHAGRAGGEEAVQSLVHPRAGGLQIAGDRLYVPAVELQMHDRQSPFSTVVHHPLTRYAT
jgi:hypothetical protein